MQTDFPRQGVAATELFLDYIWRPDDPTSQNYYGCITPEDVFRNVFCDLGTSENDTEALESLEDCNVWFCPALFWNDNNRQRVSIAGTWSLWVDVDDDQGDIDLDTLLGRLPVAPSIVIESSPGRFHCYWLLAEFLRDKEKIQKLNTSLSQSIHNADISGWDAAQLLRLPLGTNKKERAAGHKPAMVYLHPDRTYYVEELEGQLPEPTGESWRMGGPLLDVELPDSELDWTELPNGISKTHVDLLIKGVPRGQDRSKAIYTVVLALADAGVKPDHVAGFLYKSPLSAKFDRNQSRLTQEVSRILSKKPVKDGTPAPEFNGGKSDDINLPLSFWESRDSLRVIRQAAHARCASADAVLGNLLARYSSMVDFRVNLDTGISEAPLNMFVIILGGTGTGKGESSKASKDLLKVPKRLKSIIGTPYIDGQSIGSGEGIAEAFMGMVSQPNPNDPSKTVKVRGQVRHNVFLVADEGRAFATQAERSGATLTPVICSAWSGSALGQANATEERTRFIEGNSYSLGMSIGFQQATVMPVIDQIATGLPQRFLWVAATDGTIPEEPIEPPEIPLDTILYDPQGNITFAESIKRELWGRKRKQTTGEIEVPMNRSQEPLMRAKVAALLALIDGRAHVTDEDWGLSEVMFETSLRVMEDAIGYHRTEEAKRAYKQREALAQTEERIQVARMQAEPKLDRIARNIYRQVKEKKKFLRSELYRAVPHKDRSLFDPALNHAIEEGWVVEVTSNHEYKAGTSPDS